MYVLVGVLVWVGERGGGGGGGERERERGGRERQRKTDTHTHTHMHAHTHTHTHTHSESTLLLTFKRITVFITRCKKSQPMAHHKKIISQQHASMLMAYFAMYFCKSLS